MSNFVPNRAVTDIRQTPNYSPGRPYGRPDHIVIHHWGAFGQAHQDVVNYLTRWNGNTSAHYVASAGRVTQLCSDFDRAWHAGASGNPRGIGIECRPEMSNGDFITVINLVIAIREEHGPLPLKGHRDHLPTQCPGLWYPRLGELSNRAQATNEMLAAPLTSATITTNKKDRRESDMLVIRTTTPWGTYAYALVDFAGLRGARAIDQGEADIYYLNDILDFKVVGWDQWNQLVERAWQAHNEVAERVASAVKVSVGEEVSKVVDEVKKLAVPAPDVAKE